MNSTMCTALLTLLSMTLFAGNSVLCRLALLEYKMEPVTYTAVRLISGALMLWLIMAVRHKNVFKSGTWPARCPCLPIWRVFRGPMSSCPPPWER